MPEWNEQTSHILNVGCPTLSPWWQAGRTHNSNSQPVQHRVQSVTSNAAKTSVVRPSITFVRGNNSVPFIPACAVHGSSLLRGTSYACVKFHCQPIDCIAPSEPLHPINYRLDTAVCTGSKHSGGTEINPLKCSFLFYFVLQIFQMFNEYNEAPAHSWEFSDWRIAYQLRWRMVRYHVQKAHKSVTGFRSDH